MKSMLCKTGMAAFTSLVLSGCTAVYTVEPIGEAPVKLEPEEWNGHWFNPEATATMRVEDAEAGILRLAWIETGGENGLRTRETTAYIRKSGEWKFASISDPDGEDDRFLWARIKHENRQLVIWLPDVDKIEELVDAGKLPGTTTENGNVVLESLKPEHLELIRTGTPAGPLVNWEAPVVLFHLDR